MTFDWQLTLALSYLGFGKNMRLVCKKWNPDSLPASFVSDTRPKVISLYSPACLILGFWHAYTGLAVLSRSVVFDSLRPHGLWPTRLLCPWGFSRQEYWSGLPCPLPGNLPKPGIEPTSPALQVDSLLSEPPGKPKNVHHIHIWQNKKRNDHQYNVV